MKTDNRMRLTAGIKALEDVPAETRIVRSVDRRTSTC